MKLFAQWPEGSEMTSLIGYSKIDDGRTAPCAVVCRGDGKQVSAIIDPEKWPHEGGIAGFGDTLADALRDLADEIEKEVTVVSSDVDASDSPA